jgi:hypothetical protein
VFVRGIQVPTSLNFQPPAAVLFPNVSWARGGTAGASITNHARGLLISNSTNDTRGIHMVLRPIPQASQRSFSITTRVSYNGVLHRNSGCGLAISTGVNGAGKIAVIGRAWGVNGNYHAPYSCYWDGTNLIEGATGQGTEATWFRAIITGTKVVLSFSDDGVLFTDYQTQDFGEPITQYGLFQMNFDYGSSVGLCDYFYSTEILNDPDIATTGAVAVITPEKQGHLYWRINCLSAMNPTSQYVGVGVLQFRQVPGGGNMAIGGTPISGGYYSGFSPDRSFMGDTSSSYNGWISDGANGPGTGWIGYKFPYPINIQQVAYAQLNSGSGLNEQDLLPRSLTIDWSDDGINWTTVASLENLPIVGQKAANVYPLASMQSLTPVQNVVQAKSFNMPKTGCRVALALRKLFPDYNGPLIQVQSGYGIVDVFPGADGRIDKDFLMKFSFGGSLKITKWYDQSGFNNHATPTTSAFPDMIQDGAIMTMPNGEAAIRIHETPLDLPNFGFLEGSAGNFMSCPIALVSPNSWPVLVSTQMGNGDSASLGFQDGALNYAFFHNGKGGTYSNVVGGPFAIYSGTQSYDSATGAVTYDVMENGVAATTYQQTPPGDPTRGYLNDFGVGTKTYAKTRIGQSWQNPTTVGGDRMIDGHMGELVFFDPTVCDKAAIIKNQADFFGIVD